MSLPYDGPALASNRMEVRDIAPALISAADAIRAASRTLQPEQPEPRIEIQATEPGSFIVQLAIVDATIWQRAVSIFASDQSVAVASFLGIATAVVAAMKAIAKLSKGPIRTVDQLTSAPAVVITFSDGTIMRLSPQAFRLMQDADVRHHLRGVVQPLTREGVDSLSVRDAQDSALISRDDVSAFEVPTVSDQLIGDDVRTVALSLASVAFTEGNKWRLSDGESTFYARVEDTRFLDRIAKNEEMFSRSDVLRTRLRTRQWRTDTGLRSEYTVEEVLEHIRGPREVPLPFAEEQPPQGRSRRRDLGDDGPGGLSL